MTTSSFTAKTRGAWSSPSSASACAWGAFEAAFATANATADPAKRPLIAACLARARRHGGWQWPERPLVFVSATHADAEGFLRIMGLPGRVQGSVSPREY